MLLEMRAERKQKSKHEMKSLQVENMWLASNQLLGHRVQIHFCTKEAIAEGDK